MAYLIYMRQNVANEENSIDLTSSQLENLPAQND